MLLSPPTDVFDTLSKFEVFLVFSPGRLIGCCISLESIIDDLPPPPYSKERFSRVKRIECLWSAAPPLLAIKEFDDGFKISPKTLGLESPKDP